MAYDADKAEQAANAILDEIIKDASSANSTSLAKFAEALAWITNPDQPHGGSVDVSK